MYPWKIVIFEGNIAIESIFLTCSKWWLSKDDIVARFARYHSDKVIQSFLSWYSCVQANQVQGDITRSDRGEACQAIENDGHWCSLLWPATRKLSAPVIEVTMCSFIYYIYIVILCIYIYIYNYIVYTVDAVEETIEDSTCKTSLFFASGSLIKASFLLLRPLFRLA